MLLRVDVLEIHKDQIHLPQHRLQFFKVKLAAGLDGQGEPLVVKGIHHLPEELRLGRGLAAGEGDSAAGVAVEDGLTAELLENVLRLHPVDHGVVHGLALRIGAPGAPQGAPCHEYDGADPFSVVDGEVLQLHDIAAHNRPSFRLSYLVSRKCGGGCGAGQWRSRPAPVYGLTSLGLTNLKRWGAD